MIKKRPHAAAKVVFAKPITAPLEPFNVRPFGPFFF